MFSNQKEIELEIYIRSSANNTLSLRSRISYRNSTEQTKLTPDHLLTTASFFFEPFSWSFIGNVEAEDS